MPQHAYSGTNLAGSLAAAAFTWGTAVTTNRAYLNDGRMDKTTGPGAVASGTTLVIDFGAAVSLTAIALLNSNIATATAPTVRVRAATDAAITTSVVTPKLATTPNTSAPRHKDHVLQFDAVSKRYWELTFAWTGTFTLTLGEVFAASTTALTRRNVYGVAESEEYVTTRFEGYSGERRGQFIAGPYRRKKMRFEDLSKAERDELLTMFRATKGGATNMLWCELYEAGSAVAPSDYQDCLFGRMEHSDVMWPEYDFERFSLDFELKNAAREIGA